MAVYYRREEWKEVMYYARKLEWIADGGEYLGRALLYQSYALSRLGGSLQAILELTNRYAIINEFYYDVAVGNRFYFRLEHGQLAYVDDYLSWLEKREDVYVGLSRVLEVYVSLNRLEDAKRLIENYQHVIEDMAVSREPWIKEKMFLDYRYAHALFLCKRELFSEGLHELLDVAILANKIRSFERVKKCMLVYWKYRQHVTMEHEEKYIHLLGSRETLDTSI